MSAQADIILVEDDPDDVYLFRTACEAIRPVPLVTVLNDGYALIDYVAQQDCRGKLILLDLNMPGLSGLETLQQLQLQPKNATLTVVGFTTSCNLLDIKRAYESGARSFVTKPATLQEMIELLRNMTQYWFGYNRFYKEVR
ncbi:response regulator [Pseudoalteromonas fenneropenaei]|uniref:Response regulator n=1 Tax=Pseudoalteromonas fenneropenaei TaxID=1737459 RepID=A0ABV7CNY8_9GAMM